MLSYDRRAPQALLDALCEGGWAHSLVEYGRSGQYALDLQLRGYGPNSGKSAANWATLYCGLTKVLDLHYLPSRGFRLDAHPTWQAHGWDPAWGKYHREGMDAKTWGAVEAYLDRVVPKVGSRFLKEGSVQSAVSAFQTRDLTVIDREAVVAFSNQAEKRKVTAELEADLLGAIDRPGPAWWGTKPKHLGGELDALAVASDGSLLAIEIKPATASSTIPWAPLQVRHYARLFGRWARETFEAAEIIGGMISQRRELGLTTHHAVACDRPARVRPVVAIQRGASQTVLDRLHQVQALLRGAGVDDPPLKTYTVNLVGRLDPLDLT